VDKSEVPWKTDDLWLAPEYPGKLYCGHFFLTADYEQKCAKVVRFFESHIPEEQKPSYELKESAFYSLMPQKIRSALNAFPA